jgi:hypothetical protein
LGKFILLNRRKPQSPAQIAEKLQGWQALTGFYPLQGGTIDAANFGQGRNGFTALANQFFNSFAK